MQIKYIPQWYAMGDCQALPTGARTPPLGSAKRIEEEKVKTISLVKILEKTVNIRV